MPHSALAAGPQVGLIRCEYVEQALKYDVRRGAHSVGAHVRDAACYLCWAFARAYAPEVMAPYVAQLAPGLLTVRQRLHCVIVDNRDSHIGGHATLVNSRWRCLTVRSTVVELQRPLFKKTLADRFADCHCRDCQRRRCFTRSCVRRLFVRSTGQFSSWNSNQHHG